MTEGPYRERLVTETTTHHRDLTPREIWTALNWFLHRKHELPTGVRLSRVTVLSQGDEITGVRVEWTTKDHVT